MITDEKNVFIPVQNSVLCSKALLFLNCLNTFVHDCGLILIPLLGKRSGMILISECSVNETTPLSSNGAINKYETRRLLMIPFSGICHFFFVSG